MADLDGVLAACARARALRPGGRIVVTVMHPVITSHDNRRDGEDRTTWTVDDYFVPGPRLQRWLGGEVVWHHRTFETYVASLFAAGFALDLLSECAPRADQLRDPGELARRRRVPLFLLFAGTLPRP